MITRLAQVSLWVEDLNSALQFYTETLGFLIRTDVLITPTYRWVTISPAAQPEVEIILCPLIIGGLLDEVTVRMLTTLLKTGKLSGGMYQTEDLERTYGELTAKGVTFLSPPTDMPYAREAIFLDNSGNWIRLQQTR